MATDNSNWRPYTLKSFETVEPIGSYSELLVAFNTLENYYNNLGHEILKVDYKLYSDNIDDIALTNIFYKLKLYIKWNQLIQE